MSETNETSKKDIVDSTGQQIETSVQNFEELKTETEKILWEKDVSQQIDLVLAQYDHTPSIKWDFLVRLACDDKLKTTLINDIKTKNGNQQEINKIVIQYLAQSNPDLNITPKIEVIVNSLWTLKDEKKDIQEGEKDIQEGKKDIQINSKEVQEVIKDLVQKAKQLANEDNIVPTPAQKAQAEQQLKANGVLSQFEEYARLASSDEEKAEVNSLKHSYIYICILSSLPMPLLKMQTSLIA